MSRRKLHLSKVTVSLSCGCLKPKLSDIFNPKPKSSAAKPTPTRKDDGYNNVEAAAVASQSRYSSYNESPNMKSPASVGGRFGRTGGEGLAVEKDSDDPYVDFRQSMLQMIVENEIYSKDDLKELLSCFLQLNSPHHHGIIIRAFTEIWNGLFSVRHHVSPRPMRVRRKPRHQADV